MYTHYMHAVRSLLLQGDTLLFKEDYFYKLIIKETLQYIFTLVRQRFFNTSIG